MQTNHTTKNGMGFSHLGEKFRQQGKNGTKRVLFSRSTMVVLALIGQLVFLFLGFFILAASIPVLYAAVSVISMLLVIHIINSRGETSVRMTWCALMAVVPIFGLLLYWIIEFDVGRRHEQKRILQVAEEIRDLAGNSITPPWNHPELGSMAGYLEKAGDFRLFANRKTKYFPHAEDALEEMLYRLENAEKSIFLEYFIIERGYLWERVLSVLEKKAAQGVDVRVMYDGTCSFAKLPFSYPDRLEEMGIQCRVFSPIKPFLSASYDNRDHRKLMIIDGTAAFTGGMNLADEYINRKTLYGVWKDNAILIEGPAVQTFTLMFLSLWGFNDTEREYLPYLVQDSPIPEEEGYLIPYGDSPLDEEFVGRNVYLMSIYGAHHTLRIMTPYFILDRAMVNALVLAAARGVDVRIMLPHIPDKKYAYILARGHYAELIRAGVRIFEFEPGFVHSKILVADDTSAIVGTFNFDYRSLYHHFECGVFLYDVPAVADVAEDFRLTQQECIEIRENDVENFPVKQKVLSYLLRPLAPLL